MKTYSRAAAALAMSVAIISAAPLAADADKDEIVRLTKLREEAPMVEQTF